MLKEKRSRLYWNNLKIQSYNKTSNRSYVQYANYTHEDSSNKNSNFGQYTIDFNPHMEAVSKVISIPIIKERVNNIPALFPQKLKEAKIGTSDKENSNQLMTPGNKRIRLDEISISNRLVNNTHRSTNHSPRIDPHTKMMHDSWRHKSMIKNREKQELAISSAAFFYHNSNQLEEALGGKESEIYRRSLYGLFQMDKNFRPKYSSSIFR